MGHKVLVAEDASSGFACELSNGLRKFVNLTTVWENKSYYSVDYIDPLSKIGLENLPNESNGIIIVGAGMYKRLQQYLSTSSHDSITIIITDSWFMHESDFFNDKFKDYNVFATSCKMPFRSGYPTKEYYQPFDLSDIEIVKNRTLTLSHSPFTQSKFLQKGTDYIINATKNYNFDLITGVSWDESINRKAKSHIFIDQIDYDNPYHKGEIEWDGGIGRSGLEAMLLDCLVISRGKFTGIDIPAPPIVWCDKNSLGDILKHYAYSIEERNKVISLQKEWALKYLNSEYQAKRILNI